MKKKKIVSLLISGAVCLLTLALWWLGAFQGLENKSMDYRFKIRGPLKPASDIAIVVVDEESIRRIGRWPWTRNIHSALIEKLNKAGAKAIVFDILFLDPDTDHPRADSDLGKTIARSPQVVLGAFFQKITADGLPAEISSKACRSLRGKGSASIGSAVQVTTRRDACWKNLGLKLPT
jgi:CHASE2 domain-containing sensor protein